MEKIKWMAGIIVFAFLLSGCRSLGQRTVTLDPTVRSSGSESDIARAILKTLPRKQRPAVAIAVIETLADVPSQRLFAETTLRYYLDSCGFPVSDGENALLREYAKFYLSDNPRARDFPLTFTSNYYIIGTASAGPGEDQSGLNGAKADLEIYALDWQGSVFYSRRVSTESLALSPESAEIKALKKAVSEIAVELLPLLR